ncbi:MAG: 3-deoxy-D-manno-octulosonate 8-phosphate phosphatase [Bacteroidetes bacterium CG2_30_33_31]|nr:MAG: 3-deoxy-D-manno-octulosonate 8-phosphate phosphatase [Bacteroidetes bacterium CG2_30_33_31]
MKNYKAKLAPINTMIFDFDGVLSDSMVLLTEDGHYLRRTNVKDGYVMQLAVKKGYRIAIISGAKAEGMYHRLYGLNLTDIYLGVTNKLEVYNELKAKYNLENENILYMGDDIPDFQVMQAAGIAACPADAANEIKAIADYISDKKGGEGCARDIIEQVMKIHGKWMDEQAYEW